MTNTMRASFVIMQRLWGASGQNPLSAGSDLIPHKPEVRFEGFKLEHWFGRQLSRKQDELKTLEDSS